MPSPVSLLALATDLELWDIKILTTLYKDSHKMCIAHYYLLSISSIMWFGNDKLNHCNFSFLFTDKRNIFVCAPSESWSTFKQKLPHIIDSVLTHK